MRLPPADRRRGQRSHRQRHRPARAHHNTTSSSSVGAATTAADYNATSGYRAQGNNCLDATWRVLTAYGVPGTEAQFWVRTITSDGAYELFNRGTGKCIGVNGGSTANGAQVIEWDCNGNADQRWFWRATGTTQFGWPVYNLVNDKSGRCMGINGGSTAQGAVAVQWDCNGNNDQHWF
jgi:hypothetical protein